MQAGVGRDGIPLSERSGDEPEGRAPYSDESGPRAGKLGGTAEHLRPRYVG